MGASVNAASHEKHLLRPAPNLLTIRPQDQECASSLSRGRQRGLTIAAVLWVGAIVFGLFRVGFYEYDAGAPGRSSDRWPVQSQVTLLSDRPTLVVALHPKCPCSRATVSELRSIAAESGAAFSCRILLYRPAESSPSWSQTDLSNTARSIPGASIIDDPNGREAALFGAVTSGEVLAYDSAGHLCFRGGVTASRGHAGSNKGAAMLISFLSGRTVNKRFVTPVFGCSLQGAPDKRSL